MPSAYPSRVAAVRFDVFPKFDLRAGELRNRGVKVNVQPFPSPPGPFRTFWRSGNQGNNCERKSGLLNTFVDFDQELKGGAAFGSKFSAAKAQVDRHPHPERSQGRVRDAAVKLGTHLRSCES
jgi:hypothetical protein